MATNNQRLRVTELDFEDIKTNLKTYLKGQSEFSDYDFEGSGLSILVDLLAYNTHYLAMNANLALNEAFLDTAQLRSSVISHAKTLGYTPRSVRSPEAYVDVTINDNTIDTVTLPKGSKFTTVIDKVNYSFVTNESLTENRANGILRFQNVPIYEGTLITTRYTVDTSDVDQRFLLTDNRADTTTLQVSVQNSLTDSEKPPVTKFEVITQRQEQAYEFSLIT